MKTTFMKYLHILFLVLLAALLLGFEEKNRKVLTYIILIGVAGAVLFPLIPPVKGFMRSLWNRIRSFSVKKKTGTMPASLRMDITQALLCQLSHRITSKLKSAYPDATWSWNSTPNVKRLLDGRTARIRTNGTEDYNFAEVGVDSYGNIVLRMMKLQTLDPTPIRPAEPEVNDVIVDCSSWFSLLGQHALTDIISELNCHGHSGLYINETGEVLIKDCTEDVSRHVLPHFPGKRYYKELVSIFTQAELNASVENETIKLSW